MCGLGVVNGGTHPQDQSCSRCLASVRPLSASATIRFCDHPLNDSSLQQHALNLKRYNSHQDRIIRLRKDMHNFDSNIGPGREIARFEVVPGVPRFSRFLALGGLVSQHASLVLPTSPPSPRPVPSIQAPPHDRRSVLAWFASTALHAPVQRNGRHAATRSTRIYRDVIHPQQTKNAKTHECLFHPSTS